MKWLGILFLLGASTLTGYLLASRLDERVRLLRTIQKLIARFCAELSGRRISTGQMLREAAADFEFSALPFLKKAAEKFDGTIPFCDVWSETLSEAALTAEETEPLMEVGRILGSSDHESQLQALSLLAHRAGELVEQTAARTASEAKLCRSLGILAGLFFAVLAL